MSSEFNRKKTFSQRFLHNVSQVTRKIEQGAAMGFKLNVNIISNTETLEALLIPSINSHRYHHPDMFISRSGHTNKDTTISKEMTSYTNIIKQKT